MKYFLLKCTLDAVKRLFQGFYVAGAGNADVALAAGTEGVAGQGQDVGLPQDHVGGVHAVQARALDIHEQVEGALGGIEHAELGNGVDALGGVEHSFPVLLDHRGLDLFPVAQGIDAGPLGDGGGGFR